MLNTRITSMESYVATTSSRITTDVIRERSEVWTAELEMPWHMSHFLLKATLYSYKKANEKMRPDLPVMQKSWFHVVVLSSVHKLRVLSQLKPVDYELPM